MRKVVAMDATGLNALEDLFDKLSSRGKHLILSGPHTQPLFAMEKSGFIERIGRENLCGDIEDALSRAREILGLPPEDHGSNFLSEEKKRIEMARKELASALERAQKMLDLGPKQDSLAK